MQAFMGGMGKHGSPLAVNGSSGRPRMLPWRRGSARRLGLREEGAVEAVLAGSKRIEPTRAGADFDAALAGGFEARLAVGALQARGCRGRFGSPVRDAARSCHDRPRTRAAVDGPILSPYGDHACWRPGCVTAMRAGHVLGDRGVAAHGLRSARWLATRCALVEDLDGLVGDAHIDESHGSAGRARNTSGHRPRHGSRALRGSASRRRRRRARSGSGFSAGASMCREQLGGGWRPEAAS